MNRRIREPYVRWCERTAVSHCLLLDWYNLSFLCSLKHIDTQQNVLYNHFYQEGFYMNENKLETISNLFEGNEIRSIWDSEKGDYYFSVVDVIAALTNAHIPRNYWSDLKRKLQEEGSQLHENIVQLKMTAQDGKMRSTDTLDTKGILRLIESVPSPKAEVLCTK